MFRGVLLLVVTLLAFFTVMAGVVMIGSMRLRSSWAETGTPVSKSSHAPEGSPATHPADSGDSPVTPLTLDDEPDRVGPATIFLAADHAILGGHARLEDQRGAKPPPQKLDKPGDRKKGKHHRDDPRLTMVWVTDLRTPDDSARWDLRLPADGKYELDLTYGCGPGSGGDFILSVAGHEFPGHTQIMRGNDQFKVVTLATIPLPAGPTTLTIRPATPLAGKGALMNLKEIKIIPAN